MKEVNYERGKLSILSSLFSLLSSLFSLLSPPNRVPQYSPDLNPIEHWWQKNQERYQKRTPPV